MEASSSLDDGKNMMPPVTSAVGERNQPGQLVQLPGNSTGMGIAFGTAETVAARVARMVRDFMVGSVYGVSCGMAWLTWLEKQRSRAGDHLLYIASD